MLRPLIALALSAAIVLFGVPRGSATALRAGWSERSGRTRHRRSWLRPTHGGLVLAVALAAGALVAGPGQPAVRASLLSAAVAIVAGFRAEQGGGSPWPRRLGAIGLAVAVPLAGVRAELTEGAGVDAVLTALLVLGLLQGIRSIERSDGTVPVLAVIGALPLLITGVRLDDPTAPVAAAVVGAGLGLVALTWPPATVRIGAIGPPALAGVLAAAAIGLDPGRPAGEAMAVPLLALAPFGVALLVPEWDRRLRRRHLPPNVVLPLVAVLPALAAERLAAGAIQPPLAAASLVPLAVVGIIGLVTPRPRAEETERRGWGLLVAGTALVVLGGLAMVAGFLALDARREMSRGRDLALAGLTAARAGDLPTAQDRFAQADAAFASAAESLDHPALRGGDAVPVAAQNLRNARVLATVGQDLSGTAVAVAQRAGADDLRLTDGTFPIDASTHVGEQLDAALTTLTAASQRLTEADSPFLFPGVSEGSDAVAAEINDAAASLEVAAQATRLLPGLLGQDSDRRWMVAILAPSERRGAGGLAGDFAQLQAVDGAIDLVDTYTDGELNGQTEPVVQRAVLPPIYVDRYDGFRADRFWQNLSATPDVPAFGAAVTAAFRELRAGGPVEGLVTLDPMAVEALLALTGPITIPEWPEPISTTNARQVLLFDQYNELEPDQLDEFQESLIRALTHALTTGALPNPSVIAATLAPTVAGGHLQLWSPNADEQALIERIGADGTLELPDDGDFVQLVTQNGGENKLDWYQRRTLVYEPVIEPDTGELTATATVTITNTAPTEGVSDYILGLEGGPTEPGEDRVEVTLVTPHQLVAATTADGQSLSVNIGTEKGLGEITAVLRIPSGQSATVQFALEGHIEPTRGVYRVVVGHRAAVAPDSVRVVVVGAPGWSVVRPPDGVFKGERDAPSEVYALLART